MSALKSKFESLFGTKLLTDDEQKKLSDLAKADTSTVPTQVLKEMLNNYLMILV